MKKILLTLVLLLPPLAVADQSIMFEIGFGFGNSSAGRTDGNDNAKFCKNRNTGQMTFGAIRYRNDNAEIHVARWWHDEEVARCDRNSWAIGTGYVLSTEDDRTKGEERGAHASWTPGVAYTWSDNSAFTGKDANNTNWRNTSNWQVFNRVAIGAGNETVDIEYAVHRYGTFNEEHGESFLSAGIAFKDLDNNKDNGIAMQPMVEPLVEECNNNGVGTGCRAHPNK